VSPSELALRLAGELDRNDPSPMSSRIVQAVWLEVVQGFIGSGERLPTVRQLAVELGLSPRVVERAYEQLSKLGVVATRPGRGTFVSLAPPSAPERERFLELERRCRELVTSARALGFDVDDAIDLLAEFRANSSDSLTAGDGQ